MKKAYSKMPLGYYDAIFCNEDWFVIVDYYGLHYECIEDDPRARKEMEATIEVINSYGKNKEDIIKAGFKIKDNKVYLPSGIYEAKWWDKRGPAGFSFKMILSYCVDLY